MPHRDSSRPPMFPALLLAALTGWGAVAVGTADWGCLRREARPAIDKGGWYTAAESGGWEYQRNINSVGAERFRWKGNRHDAPTNP